VASKSDVQRYFVNHPVPFIYNGVEVMRGQILTLAPSPNDHILLAKRYFLPLDAGAVTTECGECGKEFRGHGDLLQHGKRIHPPDAWTPEDEDRFQDRLEPLADRFGEANIPDRIAV
jgi:hypothetical protein